MAGGAVGLALAFGGLDLLVGYAARFTERAQEIDVDRTVVLFTLAVSVGTGLLFGTAPAVVDRRLGLGGLRAQPGALSPRASGVQRLLVVAQVSIAFVVLSGAGLMVRSLWRVNQVDTGLETEGVVAFGVHIDPDSDPLTRTPDGIDSFFEVVEARLRKLPGVVGTTRAVDVPLASDRASPFTFYPLDAEEGGEVRAEARTVGRDYFQVLGVPLLDGRSFTWADRDTTAFVAVVNRAFAQVTFGGESAVGRRMTQCWPDECNSPMTIVGVVEDVRHRGPEAAPVPEVYRLGEQVGWAGWNVLVRSDDSAADLATRVTQIVHSVNRHAAVTGVDTLEGLRSDRLSNRRLTAALLIVFAAVAVGLSLAGVVGVLSLAASARSREIGIRRVLGAHRGDVRGRVVREGLSLVAAGLAVGTVLSLAMGTLIAGQLWGVGARDPWTLAGVGSLFLAVSAVACYLPAGRASATDVVDTLRNG